MQNTAKQRKKIPLPGQRIVRSVLALWLCLLIFHLRGHRGMPFYSLIASLQCIQPYSKNMLNVGKRRLIGTATGIFWGSVVVFGELYLMGDSFEEGFFHYLILGLFAGTVLYSTVLLNIKESAYFATVVFLSVAMNHIGDENPLLYIMNRSFDTLIGVGVAFFINSLHLPRTRDRSTLFISGIDHVLLSGRSLPPFTKVELNRFIEDGIRFSVSTKQTPATVREVLAGVHLNLPIIAMDGSVLYDLRTMKFIRTVKIDEHAAAKMASYLRRRGYPFFSTTVMDHVLVIYIRDYKEELMRKKMGIEDDLSLDLPDLSVTACAALDKIYQKKRFSPHRNYVRVQEDVLDDMLYFLVCDKKENIRTLLADIEKEPWFSAFRPSLSNFDCDADEEILRFYSADATRSAMLEELRLYVGADQAVTFGTVPGAYDVLVNEGGEHMIRELKKRFEPVSIKGWRNILRL
ncbi:MAG: FUSC family protein [Lachnospiraceae bacterium]|nr:FUSC family protein [Lachnospiraceae bacterium]